MIFAIEGIDGAGKATASNLAAQMLGAQGVSVRQISFPQYGKTLASSLVQQLLNSEQKAFSAYYYAVAFALDRFESITALQTSDVLICDRYVASNLAFQLARLPAAEWDKFADWLEDFEFGRLGLPRPRLNLYLDIGLEAAEDLIKSKAGRSYTTDQFDQFERDRGYQNAALQAYAGLIEQKRCGDWRKISMLESGTLRTPEAVARDVADAILKSLAS